MLSESQVVDLLFNNHTYFDSPDICTKYTQQELENILIHLNNVEHKFFKRIMELHNDPPERSDKNTGRNIMINAYKKIYEYLNKRNINSHYINQKEKQLFISLYLITIICTIFLCFVIKNTFF